MIKNIPDRWTMKTVATALMKRGNKLGRNHALWLLKRCERLEDDNRYLREVVEELHARRGNGCQHSQYPASR